MASNYFYDNSASINKIYNICSGKIINIFIEIEYDYQYCSDYFW